MPLALTPATVNAAFSLPHTASCIFLSRKQASKLYHTDEFQAANPKNDEAMAAWKLFGIAGTAGALSLLAAENAGADKKTVGRLVAGSQAAFGAFFAFNDFAKDGMKPHVRMFNIAACTALVGYAGKSALGK